ncbi:MAG: hypothetical protein SFV54_21765 [Bryobacteraceae bacterium]|nr:hypothetical protein [Bryobacteraceae bacterium]
MKRIVLALLLPLALCAAPPASKPPAKTAKPGKAITVPAGATQVKTGLWKHTDKDGQTWYYRESPFGVVKVAEKDMTFKPSAESTTAAAYIKATEDGDNVKFERPSPFGIVRWSKKKAELNNAEAAAWKRAQEETAKAAQGQEN